MAAIVIEFARFVEVRNRRARVAEAFARPLNGPMVALRDPEADDDRTVKAGVARCPAGTQAGPPGGADARTTRRTVDIG